MDARNAARALAGPTDKALWTRALVGDAHAFSALVRRHQSPVRGFLRRLSGDDGLADDLAQETFLKAHRALAGWRGERGMVSWLLSIAWRCWLDEQRKSRHRREVVDDDAKELAVGEVGEIWVFTPRMMKGYAGEEGKVTSPALDGWLPTRDMGWLDADGYIFLAGRKDDMMIRGGENISPAEVEAVLYSHAAVEEAAVVGLPDVEWGQRVVAVVVARPGGALEADELRAFCRERLATFKVPETFHVVDTLPKNQMGKILKKELRERFGER
jgi:RNA polymerase sigma factor (sigma-70 family)